MSSPSYSTDSCWDNDSSSNATVSDDPALPETWAVRNNNNNNNDYNDSYSSYSSDDNEEGHPRSMSALEFVPVHGNKMGNNDDVNRSSNNVFDESKAAHSVGSLPNMNKAHGAVALSAATRRAANNRGRQKTNTNNNRPSVGIREIKPSTSSAAAAEQKVPHVAIQKSILRRRAATKKLLADVVAGRSSVFSECKFVATALTDAKETHVVDLCDQTLSEHAFTTLCRMLEALEFVRHVKMRACKLRSTDAKLLYEVVCVNPSIESIDVHGTAISGLWIQKIAAQCQINAKLNEDAVQRKRVKQEAEARAEEQAMVEAVSDAARHAVDQLCRMEAHKRYLIDIRRTGFIKSLTRALQRAIEEVDLAEVEKLFENKLQQHTNVFERHVDRVRDELEEAATLFISRRYIIHEETTRGWVVEAEAADRHTMWRAYIVACADIAEQTRESVATKRYERVALGHEEGRARREVSSLCWAERRDLLAEFHERLEVLATANMKLLLRRDDERRRLLSREYDDNRAAQNEEARKRAEILQGQFALKRQLLSYSTFEDSGRTAIDAVEANARRRLEKLRTLNSVVVRHEQTVMSSVRDLHRLAHLSPEIRVKSGPNAARIVYSGERAPVPIDAHLTLRLEMAGSWDAQIKFYRREVKRVVDLYKAQRRKAEKDWAQCTRELFKVYEGAETDHNVGLFEEVTTSLWETAPALCEESTCRSVDMIVDSKFRILNAAIELQCCGDEGDDKDHTLVEVLSYGNDATPANKRFHVTSGAVPGSRLFIVGENCTVPEVESVLRSVAYSCSNKHLLKQHSVRRVRCSMSLTLKNGLCRTTVPLHVTAEFSLFVVLVPALMDLPLRSRKGSYYCSPKSPLDQQHEKHHLAADATYVVPVVSHKYLARSVEDLPIVREITCDNIPHVERHADDNYGQRCVVTENEPNGYDQCTLSVDFVEGYTHVDQVYLHHTVEQFWISKNNIILGGHIVGSIERGTFLKVDKASDVIARGYCPPSLRIRFTSPIIDGDKVAMLIRGLRFCNVDAKAEVGMRKIRLSLITPHGTCVVESHIQVDIPDIPTTLHIPRKSIIYRSVSASPELPRRVLPNMVPIAKDAEVADPDTDRFEGGYLYATIATGFSVGDTLLLVDSTPDSYETHEGIYVVGGKHVWYYDKCVGTVEFLDTDRRDVVADPTPGMWDTEQQLPHSNNTSFSSGSPRVGPTKGLRRAANTNLSSSGTTEPTSPRLEGPSRRIVRTHSHSGLIGVRSVRITFTSDGNASISAAQELIRRISFSSSLTSPKLGLRVLHIELFVGATMSFDVDGNVIDTTTAVNSELRDKVALRVLPPIIKSARAEFAYTEGSGTRRVNVLDFIPPADDDGTEHYDGGFVRVEFLGESKRPWDIVSFKGTNDVESVVITREKKDKDENRPLTPTLARAPLSFGLSEDLRTAAGNNCARRASSTEPMTSLADSSIDPSAIIAQCGFPSTFFDDPVDHYAYMRPTTAIQTGDLYINKTSGIAHLQFVRTRAGVVKYKDVFDALRSITFTSFSEPEQTLSTKGDRGDRKLRITVQDSFGNICVGDVAVRLTRTPLNVVVTLPEPVVYRFLTSQEYPFSRDRIVELVLRRRAEHGCSDTNLPIKEQTLQGPFLIAPLGSCAKVWDSKAEFWDGGFVLVEIVAGAMRGDTLTVLDMAQQRAAWEVLGRSTNRTERHYVRVDDRARLSIVLENDELRELNVARVSFPMNPRFNGVNSVRIDFPRTGKTQMRANQKFINTILHTLAFIPNYQAVRCAGTRVFRVTVNTGRDSSQNYVPFGRGALTITMLAPLLSHRGSSGRLETNHNITYVTNRHPNGVVLLARHSVVLPTNSKLIKAINAGNNKTDAQQQVLDAGFIELIAGNDFVDGTDRFNFVFPPDSGFSSRGDGAILFKGNVFVQTFYGNSYVRLIFSPLSTGTTPSRIEALLKCLHFQVDDTHLPPHEASNRTVFCIVTDGTFEPATTMLSLHRMTFNITVVPPTLLEPEDDVSRAQTPALSNHHAVVDSRPSSRLPQRSLLRTPGGRALGDGTITHGMDIDVVPCPGIATELPTERGTSDSASVTPAHAVERMCMNFEGNDNNDGEYDDDFTESVAAPTPTTLSRQPTSNTIDTGDADEDVREESRGVGVMMDATMRPEDVHSYGRQQTTKEEKKDSPEKGPREGDGSSLAQRDDDAHTTKEDVDNNTEKEHDLKQAQKSPPSLPPSMMRRFLKAKTTDTAGESSASASSATSSSSADDDDDDNYDDDFDDGDDIDTATSNSKDSNSD
eukprot:PhM_4_TR18474/c1_g1_i1/m.21214